MARPDRPTQDGCLTGSGGTRRTARSGTWLAYGATRDTRSVPRRLAQRIDHAGQTIAGILRGDIDKPGLRCLQRRHGLGFQHDHLDAEARDRRCPAFRTATCADRQASRTGSAVLTAIRGTTSSTRKNRATKRWPPLSCSARRTAQPFGKPRQGATQVLRRADRFGEGQALMPLDRRARPIDRFLDRPERLIQPQHRQGAETGGDLRPRNAQQILHRA